jgi:hypothetical protein
LTSAHHAEKMMQVCGVGLPDGVIRWSGQNGFHRKHVHDFAAGI